MAVKVRERPKGSGVWWVLIDHKNKRKAKKIGRDEKVARVVAKKIEAKLTLDDLGLLKDKEPPVLFREYADKWLEGYAAAALKYSTYKGYKSVLKIHLKPTFGRKALQEITREEIKDFLFKKLNSGRQHARGKERDPRLTMGTCRQIKAALSGIFTHAMEDGHVKANPVSRLGRFLNAKDQNLGKEIAPFTAQELDLYLEACREHFPSYYTFFLTLARTGMRLGEAIGLQWGDIDFAGGFIEVRRAMVRDRVTSPKSGKTRRVDMSPQLSYELKSLSKRRKEETLKKGWKTVPEWVFVNEEGQPLDQGNVRGRVHYKICEKSKLRRVRIHDLRHSYATLRLSAGHSLPDVSKQLGHSSIKITVDTYYHWIPSERKNEVAELDELGKSTTNRNLSATGTG